MRFKINGTNFGIQAEDVEVELKADSGTALLDFRVAGDEETYEALADEGDTWSGAMQPPEFSVYELPLNRSGDGFAAELSDLRAVECAIYLAEACEVLDLNVRVQGAEPEYVLLTGSVDLMNETADFEIEWERT